MLGIIENLGWHQVSEIEIDTHLELMNPGWPDCLDPPNLGAHMHPGTLKQDVNKMVTKTAYLLGNRFVLRAMV